MFYEEFDMGTLIVLGIVLVFIGVTIYALVTDNKSASDEALLDFLDQTGYSVVRLATGWVAAPGSELSTTSTP